MRVNIMTTNNLKKLIDESLGSTFNYQPDIGSLTRQANELLNAPTHGAPASVVPPLSSQALEPGALVSSAFDTVYPHDHLPGVRASSAASIPYETEAKAFLNRNKHGLPAHLDRFNSNVNLNPLTR